MNKSRFLMFALLVGGASAQAATDFVKLRHDLVEGKPSEQGEALAGLSAAVHDAIPTLIEIIKSDEKGMAKVRAGRVLKAITSNAENRTPDLIETLRPLALLDDRNASNAAVDVLTQYKGDAK